MLLEISDVVEAFKCYFDREAIIHPTQPKHIVVEFVPTDKKDLQTTLFTYGTMGSIRYGLCWRSRLNDRRRKNTEWRGKGALKHHTLTAINVRACCLSCDTVANVYPEIDWKVHVEDAAPADAAAPDGDGADVEAMAEAAEDELLLRDTKDFRGWRQSYAKLETMPEKSNRFHKYLQRLLNNLDGSLRRLAEGKRHAPSSSSAALETAHQQNVGRKRKFGDERAKHFRLIRD